MADIVKKVDRNVPVLARSQRFTNADASTGDVLMVADSLGYPASHITIEVTTGPIRVKFNVWQTVFQKWRSTDQGFMYGTEGFVNTTSGHRYMTNTASGLGANPQGAVDIEAGQTFSLDRELAVSDIQIVMASGQWDCFVS